MAEMGEVKVFRIRGEIRKPTYQTTFVKELRALKREEALEKIYAEFGSRHRVKRFHLRIASVEEIGAEEAEDPSVRKLSGVEG